MKKLLIVSSAPVIKSEKFLELDTKYIEGMRIYCKYWDGAVSGALVEGAHDIPFKSRLNPEGLPFDLMLSAPGTKLSQSDISNYDIILASGDNYQFFYLAEYCQKAGTKLIYIIENLLETRIQIIFLDSRKSLIRKLYSVLWTFTQEIRRRAVFRQADGIQANGYPAFEVFRKINKNTMLYLDNRMASSLLITDRELQLKKEHLFSGGKLRIIHSGRLEELKGAQDLVPIARKLLDRGVDFELNIYGAGSLEESISSDIVKFGLQACVFLHAPVDFEKYLVPISNTQADVFLSCHRQSDPSCTYVESMGSGLAIFGYQNRMLSAVLDKSKAGWAVPMGDVDALAEKIIEINRDREDIFRRCERALEFAKSKNFEIEFKRRIKQITDTV